MRISDWSSDVCSSDLSIAERARSRPSPEPNPFRQRSSSKKSRRVDRRQLRPQVFRQPRRAEAAKIGVEIVTLRLERVDRDAERQGAFVQRRPGGAPGGIILARDIEPPQA